MVTEYKPKSDLGCRYSYDKLENVVYLVSKEHTKLVYIDNGEAYIDGLTEVPMRLEGFNIQFSEDSSLDERYKFTKQVTFSLHGYVPHTVFSGKYYVILKSKDGTKWMVNVDFPSKVAYTFNLNGNQYQTDFTFSSVSNFPTLRLATDINEGFSPCKQLRTYGIESLRMLETDYCKLDVVNGIVYTYDGKEFVDVEYLGKSCSLQESFDGEKVTTTIKFDIAFDAYKSSWHYNLLEFLQNHYSTIIRPKGGDNTFFSGFNFGLEPSFNIATTSQNGDSDIITVTLTETSSYGSANATDWSEEEDTDTRWVFIKKVGDILGYECISFGTAKYLLQQEINSLGQPTGNYKCLEGYESQFANLHIVGTFSNEVTFSNPECTESACKVNTNIPNTITYTAATCYTYSYSASCDWETSGLASYMTVTPSSGEAGTAYTLSVCNTKTPTTNESSTFTIRSGDNVKVVNVNLTTEPSILNPTSTTINCLAQSVTFNFNANCPITVTSIDSRLTYQITNSQLIVQVPRNYSTESGITWSIGVKDCHNNTQTVTIIQDKTYQRWVDTSDYICSGTTSYVKQQRYTGTTSTNINTPTAEYRTGAKIADNDQRCGSYTTRWVFDNHYYCVDGNKFKVEEEEMSSDNGQTWTKTSVTRLGELVEADSEFCDETLNPVQYKWELTSKWQCYGGETPTPTFDGKFKANYNNGTTYSAECNSNYQLSTIETQPSGYEYSAMTNAEIGDCVTEIIGQSFWGCRSLTSINIPSGVTYIGNGAFGWCINLQNIKIPSGVTIIDMNTFQDCHSFTSVGVVGSGASVEIPNSVTSTSFAAFSECSGLTSVTIPSSVTSIGASTFGSCYSLPTITIPDTVTSLGGQTFMNCYSLTSCTIGSGVTSLSGDFYQCSGLTSVSLPNTVTNIGASTFGSCYSLPTITIPNSVTSIGNGAFSGCRSLTSVTIPSSVSSIGNGAFDYCSGLTSVTCLSTTPPELGDYVFYETNDCVIYVLAESVSAYQSAWTDYSSRIQAIP